LWRDDQKASKETNRFAKQLKEQIEIAEKIIEQSRQVGSGNRKIPNRIVILMQKVQNQDFFENHYLILVKIS